MILFASVGGRKRRAAGQPMGAIARALCRAKTTFLQGVAAERTPHGRYSRLHAAGAYQLRRRREALLDREIDLRIFGRNRLVESWMPEQISGWLTGNEPRLRAGWPILARSTAAGGPRPATGFLKSSIAPAAWA
jgi:hypothetical protein